MNYLIIAFITIIFGWGGKIQVKESSSQEWMGGLQESGYGTDYKLTLRVKADSDQLQIEDLWVGEQHMKVRVLVDPANPQDKTFKKGARVICKAGIIIRPGAGGTTILTGAYQVKKPFNFKGEGLLGYTFKGRKAYLEIPEFKKLEKIIYP